MTGNLPCLYSWQGVHGTTATTIMREGIFGRQVAVTIGVCKECKGVLLVSTKTGIGNDEDMVALAQRMAEGSKVELCEGCKG